MVQKKNNLTLRQAQALISMQSLLQFTILSIAIFLLSGGPALLNMLINGDNGNDPYPKLTALTPVGMFYTILGVAGIFLVILCPMNIRNGNVKLAKKQFWVGFALLFFAYTCMIFLMIYGLS